MSYIQTPLRKRLSIRNTVSLIALSSIMIMGGCKSKTGDTAAVEDAKTLISSADYGDIGDVLKVKPRKVENADAEAALKAVGLWEAGERISWESRGGEAGQYNFKNLKVTAKDGKAITAQSLSLGGLHMEGDTPIVDVADFSGLAINDDDATLKIDHLGLTGLPLSKNLGAISEIDDLLDIGALDLDGGGGGGDDASGGPQSVVFKGVSGAADNAVFEIDTLGWGQDAKDQHIRFAAEDVMVKITDQSTMTLRLDSAEMRGLAPVNSAATEALDDLKGRSGFLDLLTQNPQIGDMNIKGLTVKSDVFTLDLPAVKQSAKTKGDITEVNAEMPKLTLGFTQTDDLPADAQQAMQIIKSLGFDTMVFSAKSVTEMDKAKDRIKVKAASFDLEEGFDLNYKGEFSGLAGLNQLGQDSSPEDIQALQDNVKIHDFALSLEDKSIVDRGFKLAGEMTGQSPKNLRRQANGVLALGSLAALTQDDGAIYSQFTQALSDFLQDGGTMTIQLAPDEPITLKDLDGLQQGKKPDLKRLGFSAATEQ